MMGKPGADRVFAVPIENIAGAASTSFRTVPSDLLSSAAFPAAQTTETC